MPLSLVSPGNCVPRVGTTGETEKPPPHHPFSSPTSLCRPGPVCTFPPSLLWGSRPRAVTGRTREFCPPCVFKPGK